MGPCTTSLLNFGLVLQQINTLDDKTYSETGPTCALGEAPSVLKWVKIGEGSWWNMVGGQVSVNSVKDITHLCSIRSSLVYEIRSKVLLLRTSFAI